VGPKEYGTIDEIETLTESEVRAIKTLAESEMTEADELAFNKLASAGFKLGSFTSASASGSSGSSSSVLGHGFNAEVKTEKNPEPATQTPAEYMAQKIAWLTTDVSNQHAHYVERQGHCQCLMAQVEAKEQKNERDKKYLAPLKSDIVEALSKTPKLIKVLKTMITAEIIDDSKELQKIVKLKDDVDALMLDIDTAVPNSVIADSPTKTGVRKAKKRKAETL
jgi:hypothetical protein